jgi:hypothetical protein
MPIAATKWRKKPSRPEMGAPFKPVLLEWGFVSGHSFARASLDYAAALARYDHASHSRFPCPLPS